MTEFNDEEFWEKVKKYALVAGLEVIENALKLYYALLDKDTPGWAKAVITGALAYFVLPTDAVPDFLPGGYVDDLGALAAAVATVAAHIKDDHTLKAKQKCAQWFKSRGEPS